MQTVSTENRDATPELASAVYSMMFGVGSILAFFVPVILSGMMQYLTMEQAMDALGIPKEERKFYLK